MLSDLSEEKALGQLEKITWKSFLLFAILVDFNIPGWQ
jgi:hypothetical protein